ncbi:phage portal protein [Paraburkholderia strydomiana]|uniref:phage portal protein n=1 Tax=Paraburkholderia strydomiana TaxID=1245417 RepID=UPI0038BD0B3D
MSAHAYIQYADVPDSLIASSRQRVDDNGGVKLISFDGCPLAGQIDELSNGRLQVEFPWPRAVELRGSLSDWLTYHGINFTVVM